MEVLRGKGASGGIASGILRFYKRKSLYVEKRTAKDRASEKERFDRARELADAQLGELVESTAQKLGEENAQLFEMHQMMLEDADFLDITDDLITNEGLNAEYAVQEASKQLIEILTGSGDDYMKERAADVEDVTRRVIAILLGESSAGELLDGPAILASGDFAPSETAEFEPGTVLALVTSGGASNSHTAIFARTMGIPAVIGLGGMLQEKMDGLPVIVDGGSGTVIVEPDSDTIEEYSRRKSAGDAEKEKLKALIGLENKSLDGASIDVYANIGGVDDADLAVQNDAGGVGLFRSEFLFLQSSSAPDEETQFKAYRAAAEKMGGKRVVVRTLDIGADKQVDYLGLDREENPALGFRAIRICFDRPDLFKTQLRAIYRASAFGKLAIMFPMIASLWEVQKAKEIAAAVRQELKAEGIEFDEKAEIGIMVETPAAVLISDILAAEVDFFSVGTNDLTQYTLAVDRQNEKLERFYAADHPALLRMLKIAAGNIHRHGGWIGICGELAADTGLTATFMAIGIDELSVAPNQVLPLRETIRGLDVSKCKADILGSLEGLW